jgi:hypothetical protein
MGNLTILTAAFDPKQEKRKCFSNGARPMHVSSRDAPQSLEFRRIVGDSEVILFWRRGVWTNFPENGFEQLNSLGWRAKGTYRNRT